MAVAEIAAVWRVTTLKNTWEYLITPGERPKLHGAGVSHGTVMAVANGRLVVV